MVLIGCSSNTNDAKNAKTIEYGTMELKQQIPVLQMRSISGGVWKGVFKDSVSAPSDLNYCLNTFENFYKNLSAQNIELSASEEFFFEDLEYLERQMPCVCDKRKIECPTDNDDEAKMLRIAQTLQNIRRENYYRDIFLLNSVEGKDTTETIAQIKNMVQSYIVTSCEATSLMRLKNTSVLSDSLTEWLMHCKQNLHAEQKDYLDAFTDSLGYKLEDKNYALSKLLCDLQLIDLQVRKLQYGSFTYSIELNPRVNIKLLNK